MLRLPLLLLFIVSFSSYADVKLDPTLIRKWSHDLDNEYPGEKPAIAHFKTDAYNLFYLAAAHETNLRSPTLKLVEKLFQHSFNALLVEPFPWSEGQSPSWALKDAVNGIKKKDFILGGEPALAIIRANSRKIPFFGGEPDHRDIYRSLKARNYTDLDIIGFYVVRQIPQWVRERQNKNGLIDRNYPIFSETYCRKFVVSPCPPLADVKNWYKTKMNRELTPDISNEEISPLTEGKLFTQKMASAVSDVRDRFTLTVINELLKKYHNVAVVYGSGHFITLKKSFEAPLGQPTYETE